jgi:hypothetical protein
MGYPEKNYQVEARFEPDYSNDHGVKPETIVANTNKTINIPVDAIGVYLYSGIASEVLYFKLDAAWAAVPAAAVVYGGFFPPSQATARVFSRGPIGSGHTLNVISAGAGAIVCEWLKEPAVE